LGAIAVLLTLIYLALQFRGMKAQINNDALGQAQAADHDLVRMMLENAELMSKANGCPELYQLEQQGLSDAHIDFVPWIALHYREYPGFRSFVDSLQGGYLGSPDLYARMTNPDLAYGATRRLLAVG